MADDTARRSPVHPANVVSQRADGELSRTLHLLWQMRTVHGIEKLIDVRLGCTIEDGSDLVDAIQSMLPEAVYGFVWSFEGWTVCRVQRGGPEPPDTLERVEVVGHASGVLCHPGGIAVSKQQIAHKDGRLLLPMQAQVLPRVPRRVYCDEFSGIRRHLMTVRDSPSDTWYVRWPKDLHAAEG